MIGIHMLDRALLGLQQRSGVGNIGQELLRLEINDPAESGDQMGAGRRDPEERKILKIDKGFRGRMGVQIAPAQNRQSVVARPARPGPPA